MRVGQTSGLSAQRATAILEAGSDVTLTAMMLGGDLTDSYTHTATGIVAVAHLAAGGAFLAASLAKDPRNGDGNLTCAALGEMAKSFGYLAMTTHPGLGAGLVGVGTLATLCAA